MGNSLQTPSETVHEPQKQNEEEDVNASFICEICFELVSAGKKFKNQNHCVHTFCLDCIAKYIKIKIKENTAKIECPGLNCPRVLDPLSCRALIPPSVFSKWSDFLCDNYVLGFERSYCPHKICMALVVNECGGTVKKTECPNCKQLFCFQCKLAWHAGYRCDESKNMRDRNDIVFGQLVERKAWARCPGCGHCIERLDGCYSIVCRCKTRFCYDCGREYSPASSSGCNCSIEYYCGVAALIFVILIFLVFTICLHKFPSTPPKVR